MHHPHAAAIEIRPLHTSDELKQASLLYRKVFNYTGPEQAISPRMLRSLVDNGGVVLGALSSDNTVHALTYGFTGQDSEGTLHYSQAAVVDSTLQGQGVGRRLKYEQAAAALRLGHTRMCWTFDPIYIRNAHFNLNVLGACGVAFYPDYYGDDGTDRVRIEWRLSADMLPSASHRLALNNGDAVGRFAVALRTSERAPQRAELREALGAAFTAGGRLVSCEQSAERVRYIFVKQRTGS